MLNVLLLLLLTILTIYFISLFAEVRGIHDLAYPDAQWKVDKPRMALTFDDGPDPLKTPAILKSLREHNKKAIFFVVGQKAKNHSDIIRQIHQDGHQIGNHSWSHKWLPGLSRKQMEIEIQQCQETIREITGVSPVYARPPYGQKDFRYYQTLKKFKLVPVLWSRNIRDYHRSNFKTLLRRLQKAKPGDIILCHDGDDLAKHTTVAIDLWLKENPKLSSLTT